MPLLRWLRGIDLPANQFRQLSTIPNAGWKGRGVRLNTGNRTPFHIEGGKENSPKAVHFRMRPDPLAR